MIRGVGDRLCAGERRLIEGRGCWVTLRVSNAQTLPKLVAKSTSRSIESFAIHAPRREVTLNELRALAIELVIAFLFRQRGQNPRTQKSAHVRAVAARFEAAHFLCELEGFFLEL